MLPSEFVRDTCTEYVDKPRQTLKGLGVELDHTSYQTLRRVETAAWKPGKPYGQKKHSWNRRIDSNDFATVRKTMQQIRDNVRMKVW